MQRRTKLLLVAAIALIAGCANGISFTPYDYKHADGAKVKMKHSPYSVHIRGKELFLKKELPVLGND